MKLIGKDLQDYNQSLQSAKEHMSRAIGDLGAADYTLQQATTGRENKDLRREIQHWTDKLIDALRQFEVMKFSDKTDNTEK